MTMLGLPEKTSAQLFDGLEVGGGWSHVTGNFGTDGLNLASALRFTPRVSIAAEYDTAWDTSRIGIFELTPVGAVTSKSHLQNLMIGPRIFFHSTSIRKYKLIPFGEAQFGNSWLSSSIESATTPRVSTSDSAWSWMLGGGTDYRFSNRWAGRVKLDFLRTHLADAGQSRLRFAMGIVYTIGGTE
jgi:hypothetical protein